MPLRFLIPISDSDSSLIALTRSTTPQQDGICRSSVRISVKRCGSFVHRELLRASLFTFCFACFPVIEDRKAELYTHIRFGGGDEEDRVTCLRLQNTSAFGRLRNRR